MTCRTCERDDLRTVTAAAAGGTLFRLTFDRTQLRPPVPPRAVGVPARDTAACGRSPLAAAPCLPAGVSRPAPAPGSAGAAADLRGEANAGRVVPVSPPKRRKEKTDAAI